MDEGKIDYVVYTGKTDMESITNYISLHHHAILLGITVLTSLDTTNALADCIAGRYTQFNTELVDINHLRREKLKLSFCKMHSCGNDYIFFNNFDNKITCPESLAINFSDRHYGIGSDGIVMIEKSDVADCKMRVFNRDGSEGGLAANPLRGVAKYVFDKHIVNSDRVTVETCGGVRELEVVSFNGVASSISVNLGEAAFDPSVKTFEFGGREYGVTAVDVGNSHCVIFCDKVDDIDIDALGQAIVASGMFPGLSYVDCARVVNDLAVKVRVWDRINGETMACGTAAAAVAAAAIKAGSCAKDKIITIKLRGGDLFVKCLEDGELILDGSVKQSYEGVIEI